ncbi:ankyrin repeat domain-containing protein [Paenibacillus sp. 1001270B_150601_E10]|uniref:ankyrin repeat domain-containing protein n=1 Tax=Paenibacillus sp. 1001270B_150601_E10 TaxID=2787079 RepID=UPI0018A0AA71|nr:ankyrin repeat domain-containing protein [Paenibacillus sp. 1001270B_150601_E10]
MNDQLIISAGQGDKDKVLSLLEDGANINATDGYGRTAVMTATYHHQVDMVKVLIQKGADINIRDHNLNNVLLYAGAEGLLDIVKLAIEAGADPTLTNRYGGSALIPAAERGHVEVVQELLAHSGIDVNHINNLHWTALMEAVILGNGGVKHQAIVKLLLAYGADPNISDKDGITPIMHAKKMGFDQIAALLEQAERDR